MGKVYKRGDSPYYWLVYTNGEKRVRESSKTKSKTLAHEILRYKESQALLHESGSLDSDISIEKFTAQYLEWIRVNRRPETYRSYNSILKTFTSYLKKETSTENLKSITPKILEDYKKQRLSESKTCTVKNHIVCIKAFFNKALEWEYILKSPARNLKSVEITDSKPIRFITENEYKTFMQVCKNEFKEFYPIFYTFLHSGLRKSELFKS